MNDPGLNNLLKWGIENSAVSQNDPTARATAKTNLDVDALNSMFAESDAERMRKEMDKIVDKENKIPLSVKITAFSNFEQLLQNIDNANNLESLQLWPSLLAQLGHAEDEMRKYAAWCCAVAVQNNIRAQERLLVLDGIPTLTRLATQDDSNEVRKKAVLAISSVVRNFQPGLDVAVDSMPEDFKPNEKVDAGDMGSIDAFIQKLRDNAR